MGEAAYIGFGEAAQAFARPGACCFDILDKEAECARLRTTRCGSTAAAVRGAGVILSLVTADRALDAARETAATIAPDALFLDMNSVAPDTKRQAAARIEAAGGRYVDVAVMAPAYPARLGVPLLVSGPHAECAAEALRLLGFSNVRSAGAEVGRASAIKMIRSVMVKGIEALTAEMMLAAHAAGVADEVLASLGPEWAVKADYNLERMATHGLRRAAEMEESAKTLAALGVEPVMTRGTVLRQRTMAGRDLRDAA